MKVASGLLCRSSGSGGEGAAIELTTGVVPDPDARPSSCPRPGREATLGVDVALAGLEVPSHPDLCFSPAHVIRRQEVRGGQRPGIRLVRSALQCWQGRSSPAAHQLPVEAVQRAVEDERRHRCRRRGARFRGVIKARFGASLTQRAAPQSTARPCRLLPGLAASRSMMASPARRAGRCEVKLHLVVGIPWPRWASSVSS